MSPSVAHMLLATDPTVFTWVDMIKIIAIPLVLWALNRFTLRRDKTSDELKAKRELEAKAEKEHTKAELKRLADEVRLFVGKDTLDTRFAKIEGEAAKQEKRMEGFQMQTERMADEHERRFKLLESQASEFARFREDMAVLKAQVNTFSEMQREMNSKLDRLIEGRSK